MAPTVAPTVATVPGTSTNSPVSYTSQPPVDSPGPTRMPTSKKPTSDSGGKPSTSSIDVDYDNIGPGAKASKPAKPEGMSMPGSGTSLIMDHFDLSSSRSGRRRQMSEHLHSGKRRQMNERHRHNQGRRQTSPQLENVLSRQTINGSKVEEEKEVFGRRISKHREATRRRRKVVVFTEEENEEASESSTQDVMMNELERVISDRDMKRKLRRSV